MSLRIRIAALAISAYCPLASAFILPINGVPPADTVVEYLNTVTGHYFYTWSPSDQQALDSGAFGGGWERTGQGFGAYGTRDHGRFSSYTLDACSPQGACMPISRFYAPGPNSHFFTGSQGDVAILDRPGSGWVLENDAFYAAMPDGAGNCSPDKTAVRRLYNNRAAQNDSNHRYTADAVAIKVMVDRGWVDEGVAFCAYGKRAVTTATYSFGVSEVSQIMDVRNCRASPAGGNCLGIGNLPVPSFPFTSTSLQTNVVGGSRDEFDQETGMSAGALPLTMAMTNQSRAAAAADAFVQISRTTGQAGIHLASQSRIAGPYSSITALRRLPRAVHPYRFDTGTDRQLFFTASISVQEASAAAGSHAYGVFTLQFTDATSGRSLLFNTLAFGTVLGGEGAARDVNTSLPLVYATTGTAGPFGRLQGIPPRAIAQQVSPLPGFYLSWINRGHFQAILDAARQIDPALSPRPEDYALDYFGLVNEAYGQGEIGLLVGTLSLSLMGAE